MEQIRKPAWAGQFYPSDPGALRSQILQFLESSEADVTEKPLGLVVPHAGYIYSGRTAAAGYSLLAGREISSAVIIAPSHAAVVSGVSVYCGDAYETPLGTIAINKSLAKNIADHHRRLHYSSEGHEARGQRAEHALEVQLPFLQVILSNFDIVPVLFHDYSAENCLALGEAIAANTAPEKCVVIASSDLYHGYSYQECLKMDQMTMKAIQSMEVEEFVDGSGRGDYQACGAGPIAAMLTAVKKWGAQQVRLLAQTTSADVTGLKGDWTVGYAALAAF